MIIIAIDVFFLHGYASTDMPSFIFAFFPKLKLLLSLSLPLLFFSSADIPSFIFAFFPELKLLLPLLNDGGVGNDPLIQHQSKTITFFTSCILLLFNTTKSTPPFEYSFANWN